MKLVIDNNILFSLMNPHSANSYIFDFLKIKFFAPEFILSELNEHKSECLRKSRLSEQEFEMRLNELKERIKFFKFLEYKIFLRKAKDFSKDPDDIDFLALALSTKSLIWSNDSHLKQQSLIRVFATSELLKHSLNI